MAKAKATVPTLILGTISNIPFNCLVLSQANVRHVKGGVSIEELAEDIFRRGLLSSLSVRRQTDAHGIETDIFEVPAGGRRFRALERLVSQKRLAWDAPVPCIVRAEGLAAEDSLAENVQRAPLHFLDQYRAFQALRDADLSEDDIAARFFVNVTVVRQRLKLAAVSPILLELFGDDQLSLEQLMAFSITDDQARQIQVWEDLVRSRSAQPYYIRRALTEGKVKASDKRARFIGQSAYVEAGGAIERDLFDEGDAGWLTDPVLLDQLVDARLQTLAADYLAQGWKWVEAAKDFPYGYTIGLGIVEGMPADLTVEETACRTEIQAAYDVLQAEYDGDDDLPDDIDARLAAMEQELEVFDLRPQVYLSDDMAKAGVFISIAGDGAVRIEAGYVLDEAPSTGEPDGDADPEDGKKSADTRQASTVAPSVGKPSPDADSDAPKPLPEKLLVELSAVRTLGLRTAVAQKPDLAYRLLLHTSVIQTFFRTSGETCLDISIQSAPLAQYGASLRTLAAGERLTAAHQAWLETLPKEPDDVWGFLDALASDIQADLLAHCVALSINALRDNWRLNGRGRAQVDMVARLSGLDMVVAGWAPTVDTYLGRVTKDHILAAVTEAKGEPAAARIAHLKKPDMAQEAEILLAGAGWLPSMLRTVPDALEGAGDEAPDDQAGAENVAPAPGDDPAQDHADTLDPHTLAAE